MIFLAPVNCSKVITRIHLILTLVHLYMFFFFLKKINMESSELRSVMNCWLLTSYEYSLFVVSALL